MISSSGRKRPFSAAVTLSCPWSALMAIRARPSTFWAMTVSAWSTASNARSVAGASGPSRWAAESTMGQVEVVDTGLLLVDQSRDHRFDGVAEVVERIGRGCAALVVGELAVADVARVVGAQASADRGHARGVDEGVLRLDAELLETALGVALDEGQDGGGDVVAVQVGVPGGDAVLTRPRARGQGGQRCGGGRGKDRAELNAFGAGEQPSRFHTLVEDAAETVNQDEEQGTVTTDSLRKFSGSVILVGQPGLRRSRRPRGRGRPSRAGRRPRRGGAGRRRGTSARRARHLRMPPEALRSRGAVASASPLALSQRERGPD